MFKGSKSCYVSEMSDNSKEVAVYISGYVRKQSNSESKCEDGMMIRASETDTGAELL